MYPSILFSTILRLQGSRREARIASFSFAVFATTKAGADCKRPVSLSPTEWDARTEERRLKALNPGTNYVIRPIVPGVAL